MVVDVDQQLRADSPARLHQGVQPGDDARVAEEDGGDEDGGGAVVGRPREPFGDVVRGVGGDLHHLDPLLGEPVELAADGVELAVGRDQPRPLAERERGEEADEELVGVRGEGDGAGVVAEEAGVAAADALGLLERARPLLVDELRGVEPGPHLPLEAAVRPGLVGVAGQEQPLGHAEARVVRREGVGGDGEGFNGQHVPVLVTIAVLLDFGHRPYPTEGPVAFRSRIRSPSPRSLKAPPGSPTGPGTPAGTASSAGTPRRRSRRCRAWCRWCARPS